MILLQVGLLPFSVLLLLGAILVIGSSGLEQPEQATWVDQDIPSADKINLTLAADHICLSYQTHNIKNLGSEQVNVIQTEINYSALRRESLSELPICEL